MRRFVAATVLACLTSGPVADAATIRVPEDYPTVLAGLDASAAGDTVFVGPGTWTEQDTRPTIVGTVPANGFIPSGVTLIGSGPEQTILEGPPSPGGARALVLIVLGGTEPVEIRGLTCQGGGFPYWGLYAQGYFDLTIEDCVFEENACAIKADDVNGFVRNCVFRRQDSTPAPPEYSTPTGLDAFNARWTIEDCLFEENVGEMLIESVGIGGDRGEVRRCRFINNETRRVLLLLDHHPMEIEDCWFEGNLGPANVSGWCLSTGNARGNIRRNTFVGNSSDSPAASLIYLFNGDDGVVHFTDNTIYANPLVGGRGVSVGTTVPAEFARNIIGGCGDGVGLYLTLFSEQPYGGCNVFWDNPGGNFQNYTPKPTDLQADPLFCNPDANDFHVAEQSPCAPGGIPSCGQIGAWPVGCGLVSIQATSWGRIKSLYRGGE
ncbi:MAG: right-handed parallel beta-helix repeat-containing protein [bacterium]